MIVAGCSFEVVDNADSGETDTSEDVAANESDDTEEDPEEDVETNAADEAEDEQEQDAAENEQETNAEGEDENDSDSTDVDPDLIDALNKTNQMLNSKAPSDLPGDKQYMFIWNFEEYEIKDLTCDHTDDQYTFKLDSDEITFKASFDLDDERTDIYHYPDEGMTVTDKNTSTTYITVAGEYEINIYNHGAATAGVAMVHKDGVRDTIGEPIGFIISCNDGFTF